jgi:mannitol/fructose-specific phosphotransferase system IIA component
MNKTALVHYLLDKAVLEASIYETNKKKVLRHILARLLKGHRDNHDYLETLLNRLLETERKCSFVLEGRTAMPHLVLDAEDAPETSSWLVYLTGPCDVWGKFRQSCSLDFLRARQ